LAATLLAAGCGGGTANTKAKTIVMEVNGPAQADITYGIGADQSQDNGASLPWKKQASSAVRPRVVVVSAQSKGTGEITCKISIDGAVVKENRSSGEFAVVTCSTG